MMCPKCGSKWFVMDTVTGDKKGKLHLTSEAERIVGWYVEDEFVARKRRCFEKECQHEGITVEIELDAQEDMQSILEENKKED